MSYYIGLLSGTSVDGIDVALVEITADSIELIETHEKTFSKSLQSNINLLITSQQTCLSNYANIDYQLAEEFSQAILVLLEKTKLKPKDITAIGSHGQTIYHQPHKQSSDKCHTIQIGSPHIIAARTGIKVVANFRNMDMALGGQGAPLAPIIHQKLYASTDKNIAVINLGGIANITFLGKDYKQTLGYDTGPANCLIDQWIKLHHNKAYDNQGQWAQSGHLNQKLLNDMLADEYFHKNPPKSTGREYFNQNWYGKHFKSHINTSNTDRQNTLTHLTAKSITNEINKQKTVIDKIILMGGGAQNNFLVGLIQHYSKTPLEIAQNANWIEAILFAYLAERRINKHKIDLSSITGSTQMVCLGDVIEV